MPLTKGSFETETEPESTFFFADFGSCQLQIALPFAKPCARAFSGLPASVAVQVTCAFWASAAGIDALTTIEATTGEEGVSMAREHRPDLVLMDIALPGIDGVEATATLKTEPSTSQIPVVALTASVMQSDRARFEQAGFAGLIAKPIDVLTFPDQVLAYCVRPTLGA